MRGPTKGESLTFLFAALSTAPVSGSTPAGLADGPAIVRLVIRAPRSCVLPAFLVLTAALPAQDESPPDTFGHSRHGAEFDDGPRQAARLMAGMSLQVHFPVHGLDEESQRLFDQGICQQHGFWYFEAERFRDPFDPEAALRLMDEANQRFPDHAGVLYSTACWEALAGRPDDAWTTLRRAIELDPRSREWALRDDDLTSIHDRISAG